MKFSSSWLSADAKSPPQVSLHETCASNHDDAMSESQQHCWLARWIRLPFGQGISPVRQKSNISFPYYIFYLDFLDHCVYMCFIHAGPARFLPLSLSCLESCFEVCFFLKLLLCSALCLLNPLGAVKCQGAMSNTIRYLQIIFLLLF